MKIRCPECGQAIESKIGNYRYKESGLDNVYLKNIPVYECSCGISYPSIFRIGRLNELIAETLLEKQTLLSGKEIKFLRKSLHIPSKEFSRDLGLNNTTLSKWENEHQQHSEINDRLIRWVYMIRKGVKKKDAQDILKILSKIKLKGQDTNDAIVAEKFNDDYIVNLRSVPETQASEFGKTYACYEQLPQAFYLPARAIKILDEITSKITFSSSETLQTKTTPYAQELAWEV